MTKLYPPYIEGALPAFYLKYDITDSIVIGAEISIPFSMNETVNSSQFKAFSLIIRTASSGTYLFSPIYSENYNLGTNVVVFTLSQSQAECLNEGQYYKVQIAYCEEKRISEAGNLIGDKVGYFSTVGIIKCTSKPKVYINNLSTDNVNFFQNEFTGVYDQIDCLDQSEKVYSYEFIIYNNLNEIYYTTGEKLHQTSYDTNYDFSTDKVFINSFIEEDAFYSIQYKVTTINNLIITTPKYRLTNQNLVSPNKNITMIPVANEDNGYITINLKGELDEYKSHYSILNDTIIKEEDKNIIDANNNTIANLLTQVYSYDDKITFLQTHTLYKRFENENIFLCKYCNYSYPREDVVKFGYYNKAYVFGPKFLGMPYWHLPFEVEEGYAEFLARIVSTRRTV